MGFMFAAVATIVAAGLAALSSALGAPVWLTLIVVAVTYLLCAVPVVMGGHRNFGGGANSDLMGYVFVIAIVAAVVIPRFSSPIACARVQSHLAWVWTAERDYQAMNGAFTDDLAALVAHMGEEGSFEFHDNVTLEIGSTTATTFMATGGDPMCVEEGEPRELSIDQTWEPEDQRETGE